MNSARNSSSRYRGRLAPTPSGYMHVGHALTFLRAQIRAMKAGGQLIMRIEDLDRARCKPEFTPLMYEDLRWFGLSWQEGPDAGGEFGPYLQSKRKSHYLDVWQALSETGRIYPSPHSRRDVQNALRAPHEGEGEIIFPASLRPPENHFGGGELPGTMNWRFRVPDGTQVSFYDGRCGCVSFIAGRDFGDFLVWRKDGFPSYELAVVADDHSMRISEVVRGEDLLLSTARQLLLYSALSWEAPLFYHCPLVRDPHGKRLAKRHAGLSLRELRQAGWTPERILEEFAPFREA